MRGKAKRKKLHKDISGITPAYAGKSFHFCRPVRLSQDHPRLCGEKASWQCWFLHCLGSPPPMRGKGGMKATGGRQTGITPAYAGKSKNIHEKVS